MLYNYEGGTPFPPKEILRKLDKLEISAGLSSWTDDQHSSESGTDLGDHLHPFQFNPLPKTATNVAVSSEEEGENRTNVGFSSGEEDENPRNLGFSKTPRIPIVGWAHAGQAEDYEELPISWQETIPTDCRDPRAFAVLLEGDSMEPVFRDGDLVVLMPSEPIHNGCLAVVRLRSDGVLLRRIEMRGEALRLVPLNPRYEAESLELSEVLWIYPVWGAWRQHWR